MIMKATGIVRRIDELGRIVVPKEIRRVLRIREGDPLEIFTDKEGEIILKKYSPIGELSVFAQQYVEAAAQILGCGVCVCDRDQIIAVAGIPKKELLGRSLHRELEEAINDRESIVAKKGEKKFIKILGNGDNEYSGQIVQTIISEGDAIGAVILLSKEGEKPVGESEWKAAIIAANFLGRQMEG
ncbi:MAG: stage V sporulation protein T [Clostridium sp.]|nr:stage V sporulation protein T [Clostridium sp.]MCM1399645.1 stage V sporulation protein T [Clostridium sp.]MCM1460505.1 stage V sporulation protein T [Bacteroides sp.]